MHLLGTIISVHYIEKENQHALKYSMGSSKFQNMFATLENKLEYIWWSLKKTGRICMSYLRYARKKWEWSLVWKILQQI